MDSIRSDIMQVKSLQHTLFSAGERRCKEDPQCGSTSSSGGRFSQFHHKKSSLLVPPLLGANSMEVELGKKLVHEVAVIESNGECEPRGSCGDDTQILKDECSVSDGSSEEERREKYSKILLAPVGNTDLRRQSNQEEQGGTSKDGCSDCREARGRGDHPEGTPILRTSVNSSGSDASQVGGFAEDTSIGDSVAIAITDRGTETSLRTVSYESRLGKSEANGSAESGGASPEHRAFEGRGNNDSGRETDASRQNFEELAGDGKKLEPNDTLDSSLDTSKSGSRIQAGDGKRILIGTEELTANTQDELCGQAVGASTTEIDEYGYATENNKPASLSEDNISGQALVANISHDHSTSNVDGNPDAGIKEAAANGIVVDALIKDRNFLPLVEATHTRQQETITRENEEGSNEQSPIARVSAEQETCGIQENSSSQNEGGATIVSSNVSSDVDSGSALRSCTDAQVVPRRDNARVLKGGDQNILKEHQINGVHGVETEHQPIIYIGSFLCTADARSSNNGNVGNQEEYRSNFENGTGSPREFHANLGKPSHIDAQYVSENQRRTTGRNEILEQVRSSGKDANGERQVTTYGAAAGSGKTFRGNANKQPNRTKPEENVAEHEWRRKDLKEQLKQGRRNASPEATKGAPQARGLSPSQRYVATSNGRVPSLNTVGLGVVSTPRLLEKTSTKQKNGQDRNVLRLPSNCQSADYAAGAPVAIGSKDAKTQVSEGSLVLMEPILQEKPDGNSAEVLEVQEIPRPLPPMLSLAQQRSLTLKWVGCSDPVIYDLEVADKEGLMPKQGSSKESDHTSADDSAHSSASLDSEVTVKSTKLSSTAEGSENLKWTSVYCGKERSYKVEHLKPGASYAFRLRVLPNEESPSAASPLRPPSETAVFATLPSAPSAPSAPTLVNRARTSLKVKWSPSLETGGLPILEYMLDMSPAPGKADVDATFSPTSDGFVQVCSCKDTSTKVTRLVPGTTYRCRVLAINAIGQSECSVEASYTTAASVPAAPLPPTLLCASPTSMSVEWQEPHGCGSPVTAYTLERDDGEGGPFITVYNGEKQRCLMNGLKSGHVYRVRAMAHNDIGKGAFSVPAELLTGFATPHPPSTPIIAGRSTTTVIITWRSPERDGGSPITAYEVEMRSGAPLRGQGPEVVAAAWTLVYYGPANSHTLTGLSPGHQYRVRVRAVNLMGKSGFSGEALFCTSPGLPEAPSAPTALEFGTSNLTVGWHPPAHDGGSPVTAFRLEMKALTRIACAEDSSETASGDHDEAQGFIKVYRGNECRCVIEGLHPGAKYSFQVQALNKLGAGPHSGISSLKTRPAPPSVPEQPFIVGSPASTLVSLRWCPADSNGAPVTSYQLQMLMLGYGKQLLPAIDLDFCNDNENVTGSEIPGKLLDVTGSAAHRGPGDPSTLLAQGLPRSPSHSISSTSSRGTSSWESERPPASDAGTSEDDSESAKMLQKVENSRAVTLLDKGSDRFSTNGFHIRLDLCNVYDGPSTSYSVSKLWSFSSYAFRVQARNSAGWSGFSSFTVVTTAPAAPCAPHPPTAAEPTASSLTLRWAVPEKDNGSPVLQYTLQMAKVGSNNEISPMNNSVPHIGKKSGHRKAGRKDAIIRASSPTSIWADIYDGNDFQYKVLDLLPGHSYTFRVSAHNHMGASLPSSSLVAATLASTPEAPPCPTLFSLTPTSMRIRWVAPTWDNGMPVTSYKLMMDDGKAGRWRKVYEGGATSYKALKLVPASSYRVAVQAINGLGAGPLSEVTIIRLPMAPPQVPPTPKLVHTTESSVTIQWQDPPTGHDGGHVPLDLVQVSEGVSDRVSYTVEMEDTSTRGKSMQVYEGSFTSFEVKNLASEHKYRFRVRANGVPGAGSSSWSAWSPLNTVARPLPILQSKGKSSLQRELRTSINNLAQKARHVQQPWTLKTRWWLTVLGIAVTLTGALITGFS